MTGGTFKPFALALAALTAIMSAHAALAQTAAANAPSAPRDNRVLGDAAPAARVRETITTDTSAGYARIMVTFAAPTAVSASIADGVLAVKLAKPIDADPFALAVKLGRYAQSARRSADHMTYYFALGLPVALHTSTSAGRTAIDLVPDTFAGVPPDLPPPPTRERAQIDLAKLPSIRVRVAEFTDYTRLVFDWPARVAYTAYPGKGRVTVRFETLARPDFSMLEARNPAWVKNAGWRLDDKSLIVEFETDPDASFRNARDDNKVTIDIVAPRSDGMIPAAAAPPAAVAPAAQAADAAVPTATEGGGPPTAELLGDGAVLRFPQARGHATAVFMRGDTTWIVLDNHPAVEGATLLSNIMSIVTAADATQVGTAAVIRLRFKAPLVAAVAEDNAALVVTFAPTAEPAQAIAFSRGGANGLATLTAQLAGAAQAVAIDDADAGDRIVVVPGRPGRGVLTARRFVDLEALHSFAGIAVVPRADDIAVSVRNDLVALGRPKGLALSTASGAAPVPVVQISTTAASPAFIDFARWGGNGDDVYGTERALRATAAKLAESDANKARLQLARFLIAHELAPEALGILGVIQTSDTSRANDPSLSAMRGVADYLMGRYDDAHIALSTPALDADPNTALWRGLVEARLGRWSEARRDLAAADSVLHRYPWEWTIRARLARATAGLAVGDIATAADAMDALGGDLPPRYAGEAKLLAARVLAARGYKNQAVAALKVLETSSDARVAAEAAYVRVDTELAMGRIKPAQAIDDLERLRFRWRGDALELRTLRKLGSLYFSGKRWREGLGVLRIAAQNYASTDLGRAAQDDMRAAFEDLFLGGKADAMPPVESLSLFYDFIELTPIGARGDEMIRKLSDRLVAVDLLAPAEQLLSHQVSKRLEGVARSVVATKLAAIYLLDRKPREALATLNDTRQTRLPDELNRERRLLEARALAGLKQYDMATDLIADDDDADARRLRADIYWEGGNWPEAAARLDALLGTRWQSPVALSNAERSDVLRTAIAYALANDNAALAGFRARYLAPMNASPDASAFAVITESPDRHGVAFRDLARRIASVDTLERFMTDFRARQAAAAPARLASTN